MRPVTVAASLLSLLLLLVSTAQGIRLDLEEYSSVASQHEKLQEKKYTNSSDTVGASGLCSESDQLCSAGLSGRKLLMGQAKGGPKGSAAEGAKAADQSSGKLHLAEEKAAGAAPAKPGASENKKTEGADTYPPDLMDIAGMDYSPAVRKPPIHN